MSILVTCRGEQEKYFFRLKAAVNYGIVKCQAGTEIIRIEVSSLEGFFFRSQQLTYKIVYTCIDVNHLESHGKYETPERSIGIGNFDFLSFSVLRPAATGKLSEQKRQ